ncbi:TfoX/Sxy family protein [Flavobacteriaceae bacterium KMM 6897]|nr:TfoX/Sxy family protein [Flavobacteriaceae bacterium KMM 6897]MEB8347202.1 TfoX/Sxy family protein [Flavobacteriaceae bacterium KMM 6898]
MAYNEELAFRIRETLKLFPEQFTEKKMFGGLSFLYQSKMTVGVIKDELVVRVISDKMEMILKNPDTRPMDFTNRPMKEFVFVAKEAFKTEEDLLPWIELGLEHAKDKILNS